jgi:hypothetical protein
VRGSVATFARFSAGAADVSAATGRGVSVADSGYETDGHGDAQAGFAQELEDEFIGRYAIAGTPDVVRGRLTEIRACQIDRVIVVPGSLDSDPNRLCARAIASPARSSPAPSRRHGRPARNPPTSITNSPAMTYEGPLRSRRGSDVAIKVPLRTFRGDVLDPGLDAPDCPVVDPV